MRAEPFEEGVSLDFLQKEGKVPGHLLGRCRDRERQRDPSPWIDDEGPRSVVHSVVGALPIPDKEHSEGVSNLSDLLFASRQPEEGRVEGPQILAESRRSVPARIHRDEEDLDPVGSLPHLPDGLGEMRQSEGADIGAEGIAEEDCQNLALEVR